MESHLLQMRGLKLAFKLSPVGGLVASFTDAWIETRYTGCRTTWPRSHLLQMRGLKRVRRAKTVGLIVVASFTDAWIETKGSSPKGIINVSHLLQMRGLKRCKLLALAQKEKSHLLQMRGLKQNESGKTATISLSRIFYRCVD